MIEDALKAALLGLVQGLTEFLPISSSAHLKVLRELLSFSVEGLAFDIAVHLATLVAVLLYFRADWIGVLREREGRLRMLALLAVACIPLFAIGFFLRDAREGLSLWVPVVCWTISGSYLLLLRGKGGDRPYRQLSFGAALLIGLAQACAFFPGMSRSGCTIAAGLVLGLERESAARFSFLLSIPAILGASASQVLDITRGAELEGLAWAAGVAMPVAFAVGLGAIHLLVKLVRSDLFYRFGWYNLAAAIAFGAYLAAR